MKEHDYDGGEQSWEGGEESWEGCGDAASCGRVHEWVPLGLLLRIDEGLEHRSNCKSRQEVGCMLASSGRRVHWRLGLPTTPIRDNAQAGTKATGGGRVKRANVESAVGATLSGDDASTATTATGGAGAGDWTTWEVAWAAAQSEQSA